MQNKEIMKSSSSTPYVSPIIDARSVPARCVSVSSISPVQYGRYDARQVVSYACQLIELSDNQGAACVDAGGDGIADARSISSGSRFMLFTLPVPLRCDGLLNPWLRMSDSCRDGPA